MVVDDEESEIDQDGQFQGEAPVEQEQEAD